MIHCDFYQHPFQWISECHFWKCHACVHLSCSLSAQLLFKGELFLLTCQHRVCGITASSSGPPVLALFWATIRPQIGQLQKLHPHLSPAGYTQEPQFFQLTHPSHRAAATSFRIPSSWTAGCAKESRTNRKSHTESPCSNHQLGHMVILREKNKSNVQPMHKCDTKCHERLD